MAHSPKPSAGRRHTLVNQFRDSAPAQASSTPAALAPKRSSGRNLAILLLMLVPLALAAFMLLGPSVHKSDAGSPDASDQASLAERLSEPAPSRSVQIASALPALSVARSGLDAPRRD